MFWLTLLAFSCTILQANGAVASALRRDISSGPDPSLAVSVSLNGETYINKGLVAFGSIPSNFRESTADTLGGIGSAIAIKPGTFTSTGEDRFTGTLVVQPDRGFNVRSTIDYQARHHEIDFTLTPYYGLSNLPFADAKKTLQLEYRKTTLLFDREAETSGLDALAVRAAQPGFPQDILADPQMPIARTDYQHLCVDLEGLVIDDDGTFWASDEYGPYIYHFTADGHLIQTIQPPAAIIPHDANGAVNFTSNTEAKTGRGNNQGFEGLTMDHQTRTLYAILQSATIQDGGDDKSTSRNTRLLAYDISQPSVKRPSLIGEWVVQLPQKNNGNTLGTNEILFVKKDVFLILSRDGDGRGGENARSKYKQADLLDISHATDIHGSKYDDPANPIATDGNLEKHIKPATYVPFVDYIDAIHLARFGLHNGKPNDLTLIGAKWESLALASCEDPENPDDFFLFTALDNDFLSTQGVSLGKPFNAGLDNDNQFLVFRVTLPGAGSAESAAQPTFFTILGSWLSRFASLVFWR